MGQTYYEHPVPALVRAVERLADAMERLAARSDQDGKTKDGE
jgi:hypothetical protein